jgi:hypothetical protein
VLVGSVFIALTTHITVGVKWSNMHFIALHRTSHSDGPVTHRTPVRLLWQGAILTGAVLSRALDRFDVPPDLCHISLAIGV